MHKRLLLLLAGVLSCAVTAELATVAAHEVRFAPRHSPLDADGAYRDGLFLGKLDAAAGKAPHLAVWRWNSDADRELFSAGYRRGYAGAGNLTPAE